MKKTILALAAALGLGIAGWAAADSLPAYTYTGSDPVEGAVANYLTGSEQAGNYTWEEGSVAVPAPVILKTETVDDTQLRVYGAFWMFAYVEEDGLLRCTSGGEAPGIMTLEKEGGAWRVTGMEIAGDGEDYAADIRRFCGEDKALLDQYFEAGDGASEAVVETRTRLIKEYVKANGLAVTAYQDPYWDPVPLTDPVTVNGRLEDGSYVLEMPVPAGSRGQWAASDGTQDGSVVKLSLAELKDGVLTVRYDPVADGKATVALRHYDGIACDTVYGFDLEVRDGRIAEVTGGYHVLPVSNNEMDSVLSGEWCERDTRFTLMSIRRNEKKGWNVEIVSPMTHGACLIRFTAFYDAEMNGLVYDDGAAYDLPITDSDEMPEVGEPTATGMTGSLSVIPSNDGSVLLSWHNALTPGEKEIVFERVTEE